MYGVIYMLLNKVNGKVYIGQTTNFKVRMSKHQHAKVKTAIKHAINKYGWDSFDKLILDTASSFEELNVLERFYIEKFHSLEFGYNMTYGGQDRKEYSAEAILKMSKGRKGKPSPNKGKKAPDWLRKKLSESAKKRKLSPEGIIKRRATAPRKKPIQCIETGEIFESLNDCSRRTGLCYSHLSEHISGKHGHVKGLHFKRVNNE